MGEPQRRDVYAIQQPNDLNALLGRGSEFEGKLAFEGTVRIDGKFTGQISTDDTLIVGEGATVSAEITCGSLVVHGDVVGNVNAKAGVELRNPARVKGDIATPSLVVEKGVVFNGRATMEQASVSNVIPLAASARDDGSRALS